MANYNPYNSIYMQDLQGIKDRVDAQMRQLQQSQLQQQQQPMQPITQNFQIAPTQPSAIEIEGKYANNIEEVKNTFVLKTGVFITKDFSTVWIKDISGNIRTFKTEEIIELDPKDTQINELKQEIESMKALLSKQNNNVETIEQPTTQIKKKTK